LNTITIANPTVRTPLVLMSFMLILRPFAAPVDPCPLEVAGSVEEKWLAPFGHERGNAIDIPLR
ncbi:MAG TPA: hypothetical protein VHQ67_00015, partial [Nitrospiraceae bacterium]|nr:hypothetical protein [Nitrospiraceae bacterium]